MDIEVSHAIATQLYRKSLEKITLVDLAYTEQWHEQCVL